MTKKIAGLCCVALALTACESVPVVGEWEEEDNNSSYKDELVIFDDGTGERTIKDTFDGGKVEIEWEIEWEESRDNEYDVELKCKKASIRLGGELVANGCDQFESWTEGTLDFDAECEINNDGDEMDCEREDGQETTYDKIE